MKTYLTSKNCDGREHFNRIDIFLCAGNYYWSYHNEGTVYKTAFRNDSMTELSVMIEICEAYNWEFIGEVE